MFNKDNFWEKVEGEVVRLAEASPHFVYKELTLAGCKYTVSGNEGETNEGCIIGRALVKVAPELEGYLRGVDNSELSYISIYELSKEISELLDVKLEPVIIYRLQVVQSHQDAGTPWGDCVEGCKI